MNENNIKSYLLKTAFLSIFAILLVPAPLRGGIVIFFVISTFLNYKNNFKASYFILNSLIYLGLLFTLLYSKNTSYGQSFVFETQASLIAFPLAFALLNDEVFKSLISLEKKAFLIFIGSIFILSLLPFAWLLPPYNYNLKTFVHHYNGLLQSPNLTYFNIHPVYLALAVGVSILLLIYLILNNKTQKRTLIYSVALIYFTGVLILLSKRGVLLGLFFSLIGFFWFHRIKKLFIIIITGLLLSIILATGFPKLQKRVTAIWQIDVEQNSSASKHFRIYKPAWHLFEKAPFFGHGLGSHKDLLIKQYQIDGEKDLFQEGLNTHNQLMSFLIIGGLFLAIIYIFYWTGLFYKSLKTKDYFLVIILIYFTITMLFENILERAQGVLAFSLFINYLSRKSFIEANSEKQKEFKKIILIGPMPKPINGVSICNELISNKLDSFDIRVIDTANKSFNENAGSFSLQKVMSGIKPYFKIYKVLKTDIVYMTIGQTFFGVLKYYPFFMFAKLFSKEIVIHIHGNYLGRQYQELKGLKKKLVKHILSKTDKGIVLSESLSSNLTPFLNNKDIFVLYNFVEQELENLTKHQIENKKISKLNIVFLSNLMTEKGIFDLLHALQIITKKNIPFSAKIAGNIDPSIKAEIEELINNIEGVEYVGVVRGKEKVSLLLNANTFVFPTYYQMEGQPIAILEAMVAGNIVLTTKHAGIPDIFSKNNGFFIKKKSAEDIADKLALISKNIKSLKPMMISNHQYVKQNYTETIFLNNLTKIFKHNNARSKTI